MKKKRFWTQRRGMTNRVLSLVMVFAMVAALLQTASGSLLTVWATESEAQQERSITVNDEVTIKLHFKNLSTAWTDVRGYTYYTKNGTEERPNGDWGGSLLESCGEHSGCYMLQTKKEAQGGLNVIFNGKEGNEGKQAQTIAISESDLLNTDGTYERWIEGGPDWVEETEGWRLKSTVYTAEPVSWITIISPEVDTETREVTFRFYAPDASKVRLAGSMTGWLDNPITMNKQENGLWTLTQKLSPGKYTYKFIVGENDWQADPNNDKDDGTNDKNSLLCISGLEDHDAGTITKGGVVELPLTLNLWDSAGNSKEVSVTYSLKEANDAVTLSGNKVTVGTGYEGDKLTLTATATGAGTNAETSTVTVSLADKNYTYTIHYYNPSGTGTPDLWVWNKDNAGDAGKAYPFDGNENDMETGVTWRTVEIEVPYTSLGMIGRTTAGSWDGKDSVDRFYELTEGDGAELWYIHGKGVYGQKPGVVKSVEASLQSASMNYEQNNVLYLTVNGDKDNSVEIAEAYVDASKLGISSKLNIAPELMAVSLSVKYDTEAGTYTLPITVKDIYDKTHKTSIDVTVEEREKGENDFDWDEAVIYFMVTDRFYDGNTSNNAANGANTYGENAGQYHGGDFAGVTQKLDYLQDLGINTIWITPIVDNVAGVSVDGNTEVPFYASYHGYWAQDFTKLDPALGTEDEFKELIAEAHSRNMKIMVDVVVNHAGYGAEENFAGMLRSSGDVDESSSILGGMQAGLPDFLTEKPEVRNQIIAWQTAWVEKYGIDYFRVDTVKHVDGITWAAFKNALTEADPEFKMIGEYYDAGYSPASSNGTLGSGQMDSLLDFDFNNLATDFVSSRISAVESALSARNSAINNTYLTGQFLSSHDEDGFKQNLIKNNWEDAPAASLVAATLQITAKGQPVIYYGEEIGLTGYNDYPNYTNRYDFDWSLVPDGTNGITNATYEHYKKMLAIRNEYSEVFARGNRICVASSDTEGYDVISRSYDGTTLYVGMNITSDARKLDIQVKGSAGDTYKDLYSGSTYTIDTNGKINVTIPAAKDGGTVVLVNTGTVAASPEVNGRTVTFRYQNASATDVYVVGTMNGWDTTAWKMEKDETTGLYSYTTTLEPGEYAYKFYYKIGETEKWEADPNNTNDTDKDGNSIFYVAGLVDPGITVAKGKTTSLPAQLTKLSENGKGVLTNVTYTMETVAGVSLDSASGKITVADTFAGDTITVTATAGEGSSAVKSTVVLKVVNDTNQITVKVHYNRPGNDYDGWNVWAWAEGKGGSQYDYVASGNEMIAEIEAKGRSISRLGYRIRKGDWEEKDVDEDRYIDLSNVLSGTVHYYVTQGELAGRMEFDDDVVTGVKIISANYDKSKNQIVVVTGMPVAVAAESAFVVKRSDGTELSITGVSADGNKYTLSLQENLTSIEAMVKSYFVSYTADADYEYPVVMPELYSTEDFENQYTYTGDDLGAVWTKEKTTFKVWAPTAESVKVKLYKSGTKGTDDCTETLPMTMNAQGVWFVEKSGDLNGTYYTYEVTVQGKTTEACDPYARTTGVNGNRAMVIDMDSTNPKGWDADVSPNKDMTYTDSIIYELHVRDFSINENSGITNKGKFLGLTEKGTVSTGGQTTGLDYLEDLGVTHIHLLPSYDYGSVDETKLNTPQYNWGYDPVNYNVPEGSYSTDPYNGEVRVKEMKEMVKALHDSNINVIMDVVYNHVYDADTFSFNQLVPKYFSRTNADGSYSNGSGCGNDTASERAMVRKYIVDSVNYWADEYHIDGFRFDLVGLLDAETINEVVATVHENHPDVVFYGEGWTMDTAVSKPGTTMATQLNSAATPNFAYFSDTIRDLLKGSNDTTSLGFVSGRTGQEEAMANCFTATTSWCHSPTQTVNYASCHDNYTLKDKLNVSKAGDSEENRIKMNNLAAAIYLTAEGIPLIHAGEELLRTKVDESGNVIHNSYNSSDYVNSIKWADLDKTEVQNVRDYYKGLIEFRKNHAALRLTTAADVAANVKYKWITNEVIMFVIDGTNVADEVSDGIVVIFNATTSAKEIDLYASGREVPEGDWQICVNDKNAGIDVLDTVKDGKVTVAPISAMVLVKGETEDEDSVYVQNSIKPVTGVSLDKETLALKTGAAATLTATVTPDNATNKELAWTSDDEEVATVDEHGEVTAVSAGTATITATAKDGSGKSASCEVTVSDPDPDEVLVSKIELDQTTLELETGDTATITATVEPKDATNKEVTWTSSNTDVVTVDANGEVMAVSAGTATITATAADGSGKSASCTVTVSDPIVLVSEIELSRPELTLKTGTTTTLTATVKPDNATNKEVTWTSDNTDVVTVDASGNVTAVAAGTATITVTAKDGSGVSASCAVAVSDLEMNKVPVSKIELDQTTLALETGDTATITATVTPDNATNKEVTWASSDETVVTVDASGNVTAVAAGTATVTATAKDGSGKYASCEITVTEKDVTDPGDTEDPSGGDDTEDPSGGDDTEDPSTGGNTGNNTPGTGSNPPSTGNNTNNNGNSGSGNQTSAAAGNVIFDGVAAEENYQVNGTAMKRFRSTNGSNISIVGEASVLPSGLRLHVELLQESAENYKKAADAVTKLSGIGNYRTFDVSLKDSNGVEIHQLNGFVDVTMPIPEGINRTRVVVYRMEDNGSLTKCDAAVKDNYVTFRTNHFSTYVIAEAANAAPQTSDVGAARIGFGVLLLLSGIAVFCIAKRRKMY